MFKNRQLDSKPSAERDRHLGSPDAFDDHRGASQQLIQVLSLPELLASLRRKYTWPPEVSRDLSFTAGAEAIARLAPGASSVTAAGVLTR